MSDETVSTIPRLSYWALFAAFGSLVMAYAYETGQIPDALFPLADPFSIGSIWWFMLAGFGLGASMLFYGMYGGESNVQ